MASEQTEVRNIILLMADGAGIGAWTAATYAQEQLRIEEMPVVGLIKTRSDSHRVTDSAASASAYAAGIRASNRSISVGPASACPVQSSADSVGGNWPAGCGPIESWFSVASSRGKATGIVTTAAVVDATPAAFVAHSPSRYWYESLAVEFNDFGLDVMLGGGRRFFSPDTRRDGRDLVSEACQNAACVRSAEELASYRADDRPLVGLFSDGDMDDLPSRPVRVPQMVTAALSRLARAENGFVAMFETEATDNSGHGNLPLEQLTSDMLEFDEAVGIALDFARSNPGTLVLATSDHETGSMGLIEADRDFSISYGTSGHSAAMVPIFAFGPGAEQFAGVLENYEVGQRLMAIVRGW